MGQKIDDESTTTRQNLLKLVSGRVQAIATQGITTDPLIKNEQQFRAVKKLHPPIITKENYLIFSHPFNKKHPELVEKIWASLESVKKEMLEELSMKYAL